MEYVLVFLAGMACLPLARYLRRKYEAREANKARRIP